jgi:hypothetical protein
MVVVLGAGVEEGGGDARGMDRNSTAEACDTCRSGVDGAGKDAMSEGEGDQAQTNFLSGGPVGAGVWRVGDAKLFKMAPKRGSVFFTPGEEKSAGKGEDPAEAGGFPGKFDVRDKGAVETSKDSKRTEFSEFGSLGGGELRGFVIGPVMKRAGDCEGEGDRDSTKEGDLPVDDFFGRGYYVWGGPSVAPRYPAGTGIIPSVFSSP